MGLLCLSRAQSWGRWLSGLGQVLTQMRSNVDTAGMFVIIAILCAMATILYVIVYRIERSKRYAITQ